MWVSARKKFRKGDAGWDDYLSFIEIPSLTEVRSIDGSLNEFVEDSNPLPAEVREVQATLKELPVVEADGYYQLAVNLGEESAPVAPVGWKLLGYDLSDETCTSSVLNCGPWGGRLAPLVERLNIFGLLTEKDAILAQKLLLEEWGEEEPHAHCDVWQLYEVMGERR